VVYKVFFWGQCEAAKTLLAVMESRADSEMADRILLKMNQPAQLVSTHTNSCNVIDYSQLDVCARLYDEDSSTKSGEDQVDYWKDEKRPKAVGHNIFILAKQVIQPQSTLTFSFCFSFCLPFYYIASSPNTTGNYILL